MDDDPTEELVRAARAGDELAWARIGERYRSALRFLMRGRIPPFARRRFDTDDLYQSALFRAFREIDTYEYRGEGSFRRWLVRILMNRLMSRLRELNAGRRDVGREEQVASGIVDEDPLKSPEKCLARAEEYADLTIAFSRLPPELQQVLALRISDHRSSPEMADVLDVSERTVRRRIARAFEELQKLLRNSE